MVDLVKAGRDVALQRPLITVGWAGERADLSDRVMSTPLGSEPVGAGQEVRLPDWFQHQFQRGLHDTISHGRDAQPPLFAAAFGIIRSRTGSGWNVAVFTSSRRSARKACTP